MTLCGAAAKKPKYLAGKVNGNNGGWTRAGSGSGVIDHLLLSSEPREGWGYMALWV